MRIGGSTPKHLFNETCDQPKMSSIPYAIFYIQMPRKIVTSNIDMLHSSLSPLQPFLGLFPSTPKSPGASAPDSTSRSHRRTKLRLAYVCCAHVESSCAQCEFTTLKSTAFSNGDAYIPRLCSPVLTLTAQCPRLLYFEHGHDCP